MTLISVVEDKMLEQLVINSLVVFALTWIMTKSKILAEKREFVQLRYESSKVHARPNWIHKIWHAFWTCPVCSGWYFSFVVVWLSPASDFITDLLVVFGVNWLWHCFESVLFFGGKVLEEKDQQNVSAKNNSKNSSIQKD